MVDLHKTIVSSLSTIGLPVHYELNLKSGLATPCISYMELANQIEVQTDITDISLVQYQVKIWATDLADIQRYAAAIDRVMRNLDFKRVAAAELAQEPMIQKILTYEGLTSEIL